MSNFQSLSLVSTGIPGTAPNIFTAATSDSLATILAAGYLNDIKSKVKANDVMFINYNDNSSYPLSTGLSANYMRCRVIYASSNWSLQPVGDAYQNYSQVAVTAAQFNGMYAAPVQLLAAPGANQLIVINRMVLVMTYGSAAYAAGGAVAAQYDSTVHGGGVLATNSEQATDFTGATASTAFVFNGASGNGSQAALSSAANKGIYLSNATAAFTTGDSAFVAKIYYEILPTVAS